MSLLRRSRLLLIRLEGALVKGIFSEPAPTTGNVLLLREASINVTPFSVDRPTLRGATLTPFPKIYPGQASVEITGSFEIAGNPANPATTYSELSGFSRMISCAGFTAVSGTNNLREYVFSSPNVAGGPFRHGEAITYGGAGTSVSGGTATVVGDTYSSDGLLYVAESTVAPTGATATLTGASSGAVLGGTTPINLTAGSGRGTNNLIAWKLESDVASQVTASAEFFEGGNRYRVKGCHSTFTIQFRHGDAALVNFTLTGVYDSTAEEATPTNANEAHYVPSTFLGNVFTLRTDSDIWGHQTTTGSPETGSALNSLDLSVNNEVTLRENSLDPNGVAYALITNRAPGGSFNPDEVLESEFPFIENMVAGLTQRLQLVLSNKVTPPATNWGDGNTFIFRSAGVVTSGLSDGDRDGIHAWDGSFDLTGGNYGSGSSEVPGSDNELTIIHV